MRYIVRWSLLGLLSLALIAGCLWLASSFRSSDRSIQPSERFGDVENGTVYDRAAIDLGGVKHVVLPSDVIIRRTGDSGKLQLFMKKTMSFHGYPPKPIRLGDVRSNMGCAFRIEGDTMVVATFGEWDSHIEGGVQLRLVAVVPMEWT